MNAAKPGFVATQYDVEFFKVRMNTTSYVQICPPNPKRWQLTLYLPDTAVSGSLFRPQLPGASALRGFVQYNGYPIILNFRESVVLVTCGWEVLGEAVQDAEGYGVFWQNG